MSKIMISILVIAIAGFILLAGCMQETKKDTGTQTGLTNNQQGTGTKTAQTEVQQQGEDIDNTLQELDSSNVDDLLGPDSDLDLEMEEADIQ